MVKVIGGFNLILATQTENKIIGKSEKRMCNFRNLLEILKLMRVMTRMLMIVIILLISESLMKIMMARHNFLLIIDMYVL